tara:strand:- start:1097 stop:1258 length:162 start_codon:yes stop_codon:yes gene_type:complete
LNLKKKGLAPRIKKVGSLYAFDWMMENYFAKKPTAPALIKLLKPHLKSPLTQN